MQSINLYSAEFQPDRSPLQLPHMILAAVLLVVMLIAFSVWYQTGTARLRVSLAQAQNDIAQLQTERDAFARVSQNLNTQELDQTIAALKQKITERMALSGLINQQDLGNDQGFSLQLNALANHSSEELAVQGFQLAAGGKSITLQGKVRRSTDAAGYLDALQADAAFTDTRFGVLSIVPEPPVYSFVLNRPPQQGEGAAP